MYSVSVIHLKTSNWANSPALKSLRFVGKKRPLDYYNVLANIKSKVKQNTSIELKDSAADKWPKGDDGITCHVYLLKFKVYYPFNV